MIVMKWNTVLHDCHEVEHCITWVSWLSW